MQISNVLINLKTTPKFYLNKFQLQGCYRISPFGKIFSSHTLVKGVSWFENEMLTLEKIHRKILKQKYHYK